MPTTVPVVESTRAMVALAERHRPVNGVVVVPPQMSACTFGVKVSPTVITLTDGDTVTRGGSVGQVARSASHAAKQRPAAMSIATVFFTLSSKLCTLAHLDFGGSISRSAHYCLSVSGDDKAGKPFEWLNSSRCGCRIRGKCTTGLAVQPGRVPVPAARDWSRNTNRYCRRQPNRICSLSYTGGR